MLGSTGNFLWLTDLPSGTGKFVGKGRLARALAAGGNGCEDESELVRWP
jgi:hypothetical protein